MKKLIFLLLFLPVLAIGQTSLFVPDSIMKILNTKGTISLTSENPKFITFQMLLDYEKHCYNDSTKVRTHKDRFVGMCYSYGDGCTNPEHYENIWIHKVVTLAGFIQWYKNRINGK